MPSSSAARGDSSAGGGVRFFGILLGLILLEGAVHLGFLTLTQPGWRIESFEYEKIARGLLAGEGYRYVLGETVYRSYAPPLYPAISALLYLLFGHVPSVVVGFQIFCRLALGVAVARIALRLVSWPTARWAGILAVLHPGLAHYSLVNLHPLPLDALLFAAALLLLIRVVERPTTFRGILAGAGLGLAVHTRETVGILLPIGLLWIFWIGRKKGSLPWGCAAALGITFLTALAPWTLRNYQLHDRLLFIRSDAGWNWWLGNHPGASGGGMTPAGGTVLEEAGAAHWLGMPELEQMERFHADSLDYIRADPAGALAGWLKRIGYFWWFSPQSGLLYPRSWLEGYRWFYIGFLILSGMGLFRIRKRPRSDWTGPVLGLLLAAAAAISVGQSLFYVEGRHRWLLEPVLAIFAAAGIRASCRSSV